MHQTNFFQSLQSSTKINRVFYIKKLLLYYGSNFLVPKLTSSVLISKGISD